VGLAEQARRLGLDARDLLVLERTELGLWEIQDLARYLAALGYALRIVAVDAQGAETELA
jgi:hypothetical protein